MWRLHHALEASRCLEGALAGVGVLRVDELGHGATRLLELRSVRSEAEEQLVDRPWPRRVAVRAVDVTWLGLGLGLGLGLRLGLRLGLGLGLRFGFGF